MDRNANGGLTSQIEDAAALKAQTGDAVARSLFGAPSFTVGEELFWGNDRLEEAVAWAREKVRGDAV